jgi:purine-nucleoside phosphorylase
MVSDHINQLGSSPLVGPNDERFGPRFVDMTEVYSRHLRSKAMEVASHNNIELHEAVYLIHSGPTYETPAEIRAMRILGADLVGMSLVPEAMAARQMGQQVFAICVVTSELLGEQKTLTHEEVVESAQRMAGNFELLMTNLLPAISVSEGWD